MSNLISSFIIDPVVRQARRFSGATSPGDVSAVEGRRLSHANALPISSATPPPPPPPPPHAGRGADSAVSELDEQATLATGVPHGGEDNGTLQEAPVGAGAGAHIHMGRTGTGTGTGTSSPSRPSRPSRLSSIAGGPTATATATANANAPSQPIDIPVDAAMSMSSNPDRVLESNLRHLNLHLDSPLSPSSADAATQARDIPSSRASENATAMSESLPADDGMRHLRARIHHIRDLSIGDGDKARMMHGLMTERYNFLRPQSPSSFISNDRPFTPISAQSIFSEPHVSSPISTASEADPENPFNLRPGDTNPTYRMRTEHAGDEEDFDTAEDGSSLGCQHYKRNVKVQCFQCRRWYTCRHCHDAIEDHNLNRRKTQNMLCMVCGTPQSAARHCAHCGMQAAWYYCDICKLWDDNSSKKIYHCMDCGICRKGEGLGKDYIHCKVNHYS